MIIYHKNLVDDERVSPAIKEFVSELSQIVSDDSLIITAVYRDAYQQYNLYSKGRTSTIIKEVNGQYWQSRGSAISSKDIVTMALAGQSYHNYGLAVDIDYNKEVFEKIDIISIANKYGLLWGGNWKDFPDFNHFQVDTEIPVNATQKKEENGYIFVSNSDWKEENFNYQFIEKKKMN